MNKTEEKTEYLWYESRDFVFDMAWTSCFCWKRFFRVEIAGHHIHAA